MKAETLILPVLARDEEPQPTTQESMFNYVRLSNGGPRRHPGPRSEVEVISSIARAVLGGSEGPIDWQAMEDTGHIREAIAKVVPGFEKIGDMERTKEEFQVRGRTFHAPRFSTPDGRANLHVHNLPELKGGGAALRLMTVRSEGQFKTVVYEDHDLYRSVEGRDVVLLNPKDINRLGLRAGQRVTIHSETNSMAGIRVIAFDQIKPGNALMYYPEANSNNRMRIGANDLTACRMRLLHLLWRKARRGCSRSPTLTADYRPRPSDFHGRQRRKSAKKLIRIKKRKGAGLEV